MATKVTVNTELNKVVISSDPAKVVTVNQPSGSQIVKVISQGPKGDKGDPGETSGVYSGIFQITGSLEVSGSGITGSLFGTASYSQNAETASYVLASSVQGLNLSQITSGSATASITPSNFSVNVNTNITGNLVVTNGITSSLFGTASWARNSLTASYVEASAVQGLNLSLISNGSGTASITPTEFSVNVDTDITGSLTVTNGITGSLYGTSSWAENVALSNISGTRFNDTVYTFPNDVVIEGNLTAEQLIISSSVYYVTTSFSSGSTIFGNSLDDTHQFTGSVSITGSLTVNGPLNATSSWARNALTASHVPSTAIIGDLSRIATASFTASVNSSSFQITSASSNIFNIDNGGQITVGGIGYASNTVRIYSGNTNSIVVNRAVAGFSELATFYDASGTNAYLNINAQAQYRIGGDTILARDSANVFAQRNGIVSQSFRIYNTFASLTDFERGKLEWSGSTFYIGTEQSGSGVARDLALQTSGSTRLFVSSSGNVGIGTNVPFSNGVGGGLELVGTTSTFGVMVNRVQSTNRSAWLVHNGSGGGALYLFNNGNANTIYLNGAGFSYFQSTAAALGIGTITDAGYRLVVSGSGISGSLNVDNTLYVTGSRVGIGTSAPSASLNVTGSTLLRGSGDTSATSTLTVQNGAGNSVLSVRDDMFIRIGNNSAAPVFYAQSTAGSAIDINGTNIGFYSYTTSQSADSGRYFFGGNAGIQTSGQHYFLQTLDTFNPTTGTAQNTTLRVRSSISQSAAATGITRGIYINPQIIYAADYRSIEWSTSSGSGWGLYGNGTADNYLAGNLGIGSTALTSTNLRVSNNLTGSSTPSSIYTNGSIQSGSVQANYYLTDANTANSNFPLSTLYHYQARQGSLLNVSAGGSVFTQTGFFVDSTLTGATNNYGFFGNIASGSGRWNLYMNGTADNYLAGSLGIGTTSLAGTGIRITKTLTGAVGAYGVEVASQVQSDVTSQAYYFLSQPSTQNATFTLATIGHFVADQGTFGASSTVQNQIGFRARSTLIGATINNYGFKGEIPSGTGRWNLYMDGGAYNYLSGSLFVGTTTDAGFKLDVSGSARITNGLVVTGSSTINNLTGSLFGTASWALNAVTASYVPSTAIIGDLSRIATGSVTASVGIGSASFQLTSGSSTFLFVNSSGNVGIATSNPNYNLEISAPVTSQAKLFIGKIGAGNVLSSSAGSINIVEGGNSNNITPSLHITQNQNTAFLSGEIVFNKMRNNLGALSTSETLGSILFRGADNTSLQTNASIYAANGGATNSGILSFNTNNLGTFSEKLRIFSNGNVLIQNGGTFTDTGHRLIVQGAGISGSLNVDNTLFVSGGVVLIESASLDYQQNLSVQTGSWQTIVASPTGSYKAAFFDYVAFSGSIGRAGTVTTFWSASATEFYENYTEDLGGSTAGVVLQTAISSSQIVLQATASSAAWTIRSLVRLL